MDVIERLKKEEEFLWQNPKKLPFSKAQADCPVKIEEIREAEERLRRFAAYFLSAFPETERTGGLLESELRSIPRMKKRLEKESGREIPGELYLKLDSDLPVSGSIKARGGIYEVLFTAEKIARENGFLPEGVSYDCFDTKQFRDLFAGYSIAVGSTGNLGLSIGIMSAKLGFRVTVHMSRDARQWKKDLLRKKGVTVVEYDSDYSTAVKEGREKAKGDPFCHFVDDENSRTLFLGYSVAALRLEAQLREKGIVPDPAHPLCVYLPCGVGGGPGGVAFGLKQVFGDSARCYFAEPTHSPSMLLGLATGRHDQIAVSEIGLDNRTVADGLAVGRPSRFVGRVMEPFLDGVFTVSDQRMLRLLTALSDEEKIRLEPSALAGMPGPLLVSGESPVPEGATHVVWATGGGMVPPEEMEKYLEAGRM